jgi:CheY-like chemotaxis protein
MATTSGGQRSVLVVDDDDDTLVSICELLEANGYRALRAHSGPAALQVAATAEPPPRLVLLDWWLPTEPAGVHLVTALRTQLGEKLPIVVISGDPQALDEARRAAVTDYLPKPFVVGDLIDVVDSHCP